MIIEVTKKFSSRYTRSKVRKLYDENFGYILDELLNNDIDEENKDKYYQAIISSIINLGYAKDLIIALSSLIKKLAVDELHIVEDIYGINLRPLANFAEKTYNNAVVWRPRKTKEEDYYNVSTIDNPPKYTKPCQYYVQTRRKVFPKAQ